MVNEAAASGARGALIPEFIPEPLARCAAGEISPELALMELVSQLRSDQTEEALGSAIWNALEKREAIRAERLAKVQRLWDRHATDGANPARFVVNMAAA